MTLFTDLYFIRIKVRNAISGSVQMFFGTGGPGRSCLLVSIFIVETESLVIKVTEVSFSLYLLTSAIIK